MKRRSFIGNGIYLAMVISLVGIYACKENKKQQMEEIKAGEETAVMETKPVLKLSLAQWSVHRMIKDDGMDPYLFAEKAKSWGFSGLEYVSQLYSEVEASNFSKEAMDNFVQKSKAESEKHGLENLIIMIDHQGDLSAADAMERKTAVEKHFKWVDAAAELGCHSVRVNLMGSKTAEEWTQASIDGLTQLSTYAKDKNINVIVENHGGLSSNAALLAEVIKKVNLPNCGTLPDFGNFCTKREDGSYFSTACIEEYDRYKGIAELMPYAKAVSAKSHDFDEAGNEIHTNYERMMKIVTDTGYSGYIGVEYEGNKMGEEEGILATRNLLTKLLNPSS